MSPTYEQVKKHIKTKNLSEEQKAKLESLKELDELEKLAESVDVTSTNYPLHKKDE